MSYVKGQLHINIRHCVHIGRMTWFGVSLLCGVLGGGVWAFRLTIDTRESEHYAFVDFCEAHPNVTECQAAEDDHRRLSELIGTGTQLMALSCRRRQLSGSAADNSANCTHGTEYYSCETEETAFAAAVSTLVIGWALFFIQLAVAVNLQAVWWICFDKLGLPSNDDVTGLQEKLREWQGKVEAQNLNTKADWEAHCKVNGAVMQPPITAVDALKDVYPSSKERRDQTWTQFLQLSNCFYAAVWWLHTRAVVHSKLHWPYGWDFVHFLPSFWLVYWLVPRTSQLQALLAAMLRQDTKLVAQTFAFMDEVVLIRDRIHQKFIAYAEAAEQYTLHVRNIGPGQCKSEELVSQVFGRFGDVASATFRIRTDQDTGQDTSWALVRMVEQSAARDALVAADADEGILGLDGKTRLQVTRFSKAQAAISTGGMVTSGAHLVKPGDADVTQIQMIELASRHFFDHFDKDNSGGLSYREILTGLIRLGVNIGDSEYKHMCRVIDPDLNNIVRHEEWMAFMTLSTADLQAKQVAENSEGHKTMMPTTKNLLNPIGAVRNSKLSAERSVQQREKDLMDKDEDFVANPLADETNNNESKAIAAENL